MDTLVAEARYNKCSVLQINEKDTTIYSQHFFDSNGRTDSAVYFVNSPSGTYYEVNTFDGTSTTPKSIRRFKLYDESGQRVQPHLIFESFLRNGKEYEVYYGNDGMLNYSEFINNNDQSHISRKYFSEDSALLNYVLYSYNQKKQMVLSEKFDPDSSRIGHRVFEYSYSNSIASKETTFVRDTFYMELQRVFKDCYNVSEEADLNHTKKVQSRILYSFRNDGLPTSFRIEGVTESESTTWVYTYE